MYLGFFTDGKNEKVKMVVRWHRNTKYVWINISLAMKRKPDETKKKSEIVSERVVH